MRLRQTILAALLLGIGYVLHQITPPILFGMKPDFSLAMLFVVVLTFDSFSISAQSGVIAGIIGALTTAFPGGQIANLVDKSLTAVFAYILTRALRPVVNQRVLAAVVGGVSTLFSGAVFLGTAALTVGLPGPFKALYATVVLPTAAINVFSVAFLYSLVRFSSRAVGAPRTARP